MSVNDKTSMSSLINLCTSQQENVELNQPVSVGPENDGKHSVTSTESNSSSNYDNLDNTHFFSNKQQEFISKLLMNNILDIKTNYFIEGKFTSMYKVDLLINYINNILESYLFKIEFFNLIKSNNLLNDLLNFLEFSKTETIEMFGFNEYVQKIVVFQQKVSLIDL